MEVTSGNHFHATGKQKATQKQGGFQFCESLEGLCGFF